MHPSPAVCRDSLSLSSCLADGNTETQRGLVISATLGQQVSDNAESEPDTRYRSHLQSLRPVVSILWLFWFVQFKSGSKMSCFEAFGYYLRLRFSVCSHRRVGMVTRWVCEGLSGIAWIRWELTLRMEELIQTWPMCLVWHHWTFNWPNWYV